MVQPREWVTQVKEFWRDTRAEMKKVSWPARHEVVGTTAVVIASVIFFGLYLWLCDLAFYKVINMIFTQFGARA